MHETILVTGGAGFIGSHLVDAILRANRRVRVLDNFVNGKRANVEPHLSQIGYRLVEGDIRDDRDLQGAMAGVTHVFHLACSARAGVRPSLTEPVLYEDVNCVGTLRLLEAARAHGPRVFIFGSSSSVYGINKKVPFAEDDPVEQPISPYATTKRTGELICYNYHHLYDFRVSCLRFFTVFGPRQRPEMAIHKFTNLLAGGATIPLFGDGDSRRDYTYVDDIVDGVVAALDLEADFEIFNLGGAQTTALGELVETLARELAVEPRIEYLPDQPGDVPITFADVSKAQRLLGYSPKVPIGEGLKRFVAWYQESKTSAPG